MRIPFSRVITPLLILTVTACSTIEKAKTRKLFVQGMIGTGALAENKDTPAGVPDDQEMKAGTALTAGFGYRWERFSLEFLVAHLGKPEIKNGDYYTEKHEPMFIGGGLHWTWNWFDLKLGWGNVKDKVSFEAGPQTGSFSVTPNNERTSSPAGYFGLGANFNLGKDTELIIDYTAYAWTVDEPRTFIVNSSTSSFSESENGVGVLSLGLRWFL